MSESHRGYAAQAVSAIQLYVTVKVDVNELSSWRSDRGAAFLNGIAQVLAATKGQRFDAQEPADRQKPTS